MAIRQSLEREYAVIETDEHDASFLKVQPYISVILNVDNDHLDPKGPFKGDFLA